MYKATHVNEISYFVFTDEPEIYPDSTQSKGSDRRGQK